MYSRAKLSQAIKPAKNEPETGKAEPLELSAIPVSAPVPDAVLSAWSEQENRWLAYDVWMSRYGCEVEA